MYSGEFKLTDKTGTKYSLSRFKDVYKLKDAAISARTPQELCDAVNKQDDFGERWVVCNDNSAETRFKAVDRLQNISYLTARKTKVLSESEVYLFNVVGIDDLEGTTFARCTSKEKAEKAKKLIEEQGFENMLDIEKDALPIDVISIGGRIFAL